MDGRRKEAKTAAVAKDHKNVVTTATATKDDQSHQKDQNDFATPSVKPVT